MATTTFIESGTDATQDFTFFNPVLNIGTGSTLTSATDQSNDGPRSIKSVVTTPGQSAQCASPDGIVSDTGALVSAWFRFSSVTPATRTLITSAQQAGNGSSIIYVGLETTGKLSISGRACTVISGNTVLSANTWYRISFGYVVTTTTNWSAVLYVNGVSEATTSNADGTLAATTTSCVGFGSTTSSQNGFTTNAANTIWIDSIYVDNRTDKSDCGNVHVTAKRPFSNGTANNFTTQIGAGGSGYGSGHASQVNEQPLNTANGWSVVAVAATTEEYNIESSSTGDVDISAATLVDYMGWVYTKALLAETGQIIVNNVTSNISITTSNAMFTKAAGSTTYPAGTGTDIGEITSTTATTVSLYECGIVFAYMPATAGAASVIHNFSLLGVGT